MACIYKYKGHTFNSELELDDFILEKLPFEPTMGDLVFSMTEQQLNVSSQLSKIAKDSHELVRKYQEMLNNNKVLYNEDGEMALEDPPYIGVNKFLSGLKNESGELLFPEFREEEYWTRRYANWKVGQFTDAEIEEFELDKNNLPKITEASEHKRLRDQMTHKWEVQAKTGSAIHNIFQICFQKEEGVYNFSLDDAQLEKIIESKLEEKNKPYIKGDIVQQAIKYARELNAKLTEKFGEGCAYYPEFMVSQDTNIIEKGHPTKLMGIIDLLIVDPSGKVHILDYKTSIHDYHDFVQAKKNSYSYQLGTYQRMLQKYGVQTYQGQLMVAPIQITDFKKDGDSYTYSGITTSETITEVGVQLNADKMWENIDEFMPAPFKLNITTSEAIKTTSEMMAKWFPNYRSNYKINREDLIKRLKQQNKLEKNENGQYVYTKYDSKETIVATEEGEFVDKILKYEQGLPAKRLEVTARVKNALTEAIKNGIDNVDFPTPTTISSDGSTTWLKDTLSPYCNGLWEIEDNHLLESFGVIMLKTKDGVSPKQIEFVRVSTNTLRRDHRAHLDKESRKNVFMERKGLLSNYENDVIQKSKSNSLMVEGVQGNVELIETLLLINQMKGLEGCTIGNVQVVNPIQANGISLTNEELIYCWNELNKHDKVNFDNIKNGDIKFANKYEIARNKFANIMRLGAKCDWKDNYRLFGKLRTSLPVLDENINGTTEEKISALKELLNKISQSDNARTLDKVYSEQSDLKSEAVDLYNSILQAIAQLKGVNFRQQLNDHDKFVESLAMWKNGLSGTYIDNPGNMDSETLNLVTGLVTEAYQNTRDDIQREKPKIYKLIEKLKKEKGFNVISENTIGNQTSLYSNMFQPYTKGGDFLFKNPNDLQGAEKEFLTYALDKINRNRYPGKTDEEYEYMKNSGSIDYYRVPLAKGGEDSIASTRGLLSALRTKLSYLNPKTAFQNAREKVEGIFNADEDISKQQQTELIYKMSTMFDGGENTEKRIKKLQDKGEDFFEHNLETLLYKHMFSYSVKNNMDGVFPMIKAAMAHICTQGAMQNHKFSEDIHYLDRYIRNKIYNQSIIDPKLQDVAKKLGLLKQAASKLTLAFAPVQAFYQPLQGLWTDISLMIRKPDGKDSFTFSHFTKALKMVYSDLGHFSDSPTICSSLNEIYGINDMDMNTYTERISNAKKGIWNFENFMFKFASRPDFYNRMSIFLSQMMGDGCLEAHTLKDGELIYDWKKDKRFEAFANGRTSDPKYHQQKTLYYTIAQQFVNEHAKVKLSDGKVTDFKLDMSKPMPLPRAYTNKQAESMKSLGDDIYGYYSHEKKSLIMSTTLGSLWLQFKTYWSGKKNQYLQSGGVRLRGNWEHYEENGEKYYYQTDKNGNTLFNEPPKTEKELKEMGQKAISPVMQWKGQWQEGIILTLSDLAKTAWNNGVLSTNPNKSWNALKTAWNEKWNAQDENLRTAYQNNIKQLLYDFSMFLIGGCILGALLGDWLDELKDDNKKNKDFVTGLGIAAANVAVLSVKNSFLDFNAIDSIGGAVQTWTPFSFDWTTGTLKNAWKVATGDEDFWDGVIKTSGGLRQIKPALDAIKPDMFRTKSEGGTFGQ